MKLFINLLLSTVMLALCLYLVWPAAPEREQLRLAIDALQWREFAPDLAIYVALMFVVHFARAWRWNNLLAPLKIRLGAGPLLAISSVGFLAILALPARLGEFVRPGLLRGRGKITTAEALGTVAVERVVDGMMVSLFVFGAFFALRGPQAPGWMMPTAYVALGIFSAALIFLILALRNPQPTVTFFLKLSLLPRFAPKIANVIEVKLLELIRGCAALADVKQLVLFTSWSVLYWGANGAALWVLAGAFHLDLSLLGAFATMGLVAVGITLPNSPGLVGQFQVFTMMGLQVYLGAAVAKGGSQHSAALAFAIAHHMTQVIWYTAMGILALASPWVSFKDLKKARHANDAIQPLEADPLP
ncbi:MAG TPA: lysylphosphatidylglycerol synthase transmembrane domain-containing protein, partial [Kofleriaceae bacterium]|nr:lysylphosphatidylglycerol synthase transmembrane domain-containing protein [Kofleriaceae bacterium]